MRLPQHLLDSPFFTFQTAEELVASIGVDIDFNERIEILRLSELGLPPIASQTALAVMLGVNPGLIISIKRNPKKYYREFSIPKGKGRRQIQAPRIALKIIQKWLSVHLHNKFNAPEHVFGFVRGKSHIDASIQHLGAKWVASFDIKDFFQTTPKSLVELSLISIGYGQVSADIIASIACLGGHLAQGSPCSPILSNMCFREIDFQLSALAKGYGVNISRYADDIVISGAGEMPPGIHNNIVEIIKQTPWKLSENKTNISKLPDRLKVHGILVHGEQIRLTKGYRNRIRALKYLMKNGLISDESLKKSLGHINYSDQVERKADLNSLPTAP